MILAFISLSAPLHPAPLHPALFRPGGSRAGSTVGSGSGSGASFRPRRRTGAMCQTFESSSSEGSPNMKGFVVVVVIVVVVAVSVGHFHICTEKKKIEKKRK